MREGDAIRFDSGAVLRDGVLLDPAGAPLPLRRPQQMSTRWYGFAFTFPGCGVYEPQPAGGGPLSTSFGSL